MRLVKPVTEINSALPEAARVQLAAKILETEEHAAFVLHRVCYHSHLGHALKR